MEAKQFYRKENMGRYFIYLGEESDRHKLVEASQDYKPFLVKPIDFLQYHKCDPPEFFTCPKRRVNVTREYKERADYNVRGTKKCSFCGEEHNLSKK